MAGYWPNSPRSIKNAKRKRGRYPAILTSLDLKGFLYDIPRLHVALYFYFCCKLYSETSSTFSVFSSSISIPREIAENSFIFAKENVRAPP